MSSALPAMVPLLDAAHKTLEGRMVLSGVSLSLVQDGVTCLLGPSGCGKTTLLRVASGLLPPDKGSLSIDPRMSAMVFQEPRLLPWLTVAENLSLALESVPRSERPKAIAAVLNLVGLDGTGNAMPRELSGGMAQRVGLARALLRRPQFLFMDEPFAALDAMTRAAHQDMLAALVAEQRITCLFVTHDIDEALCLARHIYVMNHGEIIAAHPWGGDCGDHDARTTIKQRILREIAL